MKPKVTKYKKYHSPKRKDLFRKNNYNKNKTELIYSNYGIISCEPSFITGKQIEAINLTIKRTLKRRGKIIFRVFPHRSKTKKPLEVRMGKGKGNVST
jgi:large subunit ribosomal protein L16